MAQVIYEANSNGRNGYIVTRSDAASYTANPDGVAVVINTDSDRTRNQMAQQLVDISQVINRDLISVADNQGLPTSGSVEI